jgi:hypothetical protein
MRHSASNGFTINKQVVFDHDQGLPQRGVIIEWYILEGVFRQQCRITDDVTNMCKVGVRVIGFDPYLAIRKARGNGAVDKGLKMCSRGSELSGWKNLSVAISDFTYLIIDMIEDPCGGKCWNTSIEGKPMICLG